MTYIGTGSFSEGEAVITHAFKGMERACMTQVISAPNDVIKVTELLAGSNGRSLKNMRPVSA